MKKGDIQLLKESVKNLIEIEKTMEESFKSRDAKKFNDSKKLMIDIQEKILKALK